MQEKLDVKKAQLITFEKDFPISDIIKCNKIGLTSGASAPEKLVKDFIIEIKKHIKVSIHEYTGAIENVSFKLPKM